jgi:hypothetical protein
MAPKLCYLRLALNLSRVYCARIHFFSGQNPIPLYLWKFSGELKMTKNVTYFSTILAVMLLLALSAIAQRTTGDIQGTVTDPNGAVVPGASVTITGKDVGFNRTVTADNNGVYRVVQIPPGTYTVTVAGISGFTSQTKNNVQVSVNNLTTTDFTLTASTAVSVDVTGEGALIDATDTKAQTNISASQIEALPKGTGFTSLLKTTVAVRPEPLGGQFTINGATGPENSFLVDGQETQNYYNGLLNTNNDIPYQAVQEIQVKTSGFEAEFGGATGGVVQAITKSGSDSFHGEFGMNISSQKWNAGPRPVLSNQLIQSLGDTGQYFEYLPQKRDAGTVTIPTLSVSGPIIKGKLWFFAIQNPRIIETTRTTNFVTNGVVNGVRGPHLPAAITNPLVLQYGGTTTQTASERTTYHYSNIRIDAAPTDKLRVFSSFTWNPIVDKGALLGGTYVIGQPTADANYGKQGADLFALGGGRQNSNNFRVEGTYTATNNLIVNARYTRAFQNQKLGGYGLTNAPRVICQSFQSIPGGASSATLLANSGCGFTGFQSNRSNDVINRNISIRTSFDANATFLANLAGHHEFKFGWERSDILNDISSGTALAGGRAYLYYGRTTFRPQDTFVQWNINAFPGAAGGIWPTPTLPAGVSIIGTGVNYQFASNGKATDKANVLFVQDKWQPSSRLTFNLGVRIEDEQIPAFNNNAIDLKWGWGDKIAPRLGVAYDLTGDGKTKISAFYGRFFDRLKFALPQGSFGGQFYHVSYFYILSNAPGYQNYTVATLHGNYTFPNNGVCPINNGTTAGGTAYVCDQDYRIASNVQGADPLLNGAVDPNVKPYQQSEATVEFQREIMKSSVITGRFLWRNLDHVIEDTGIPTDAGEAYVIGNPGEGLAAQIYQQLGYNKAPKAQRTYKAVQVEYDSRYFRSLSFNANYTWSRLFGNYSGLANPDELTAGGAPRLDPNVSRGFDEPWVGFTASGQPDNGLLPLDRTHVFKASGTYSFDWWRSKTNDTDFSFFYTLESGTPRTSFVNIFGIPIPQTKRGDLGRTPAFSQTDINISHKYRFGRDLKYAVAVDLNVINLFNQDIPLAFNQNVSSGYFALDQTDVVASGSTVDAVNVLTSHGVLSQYTTGVQNWAVANGVPAAWASNVSFGRPITFQEPRSIRLGFRFMF